MLRNRILPALVSFFLLCSCAFAQQKSAPVQPMVSGIGDPNAYVRAQFGPLFRLLPNYPMLTGDLDADGTEDLFLIATTKDPLIDQGEFHFKTIDPYNAFFGWSDPRDTFQFATAEGDARILLIVQDWRAATPKAKFAVINLQFEKLSLSRYLMKKKVVPALELEDRTGLTSDLFWDAKHKQWKWADKSLKND